MSEKQSHSKLDEKVHQVNSVTLSTLDNTKPKFDRIWAGLLSAGIALGTGLVYGISQSFTSLPPPAPGCTPIVTQVSYEKLKIGMSQTDVEARIGPGTEISRSHNQVTLEWENCDGSGIEVLFEEDRLKNKKQDGLK